jgi:hypothetical protein
MKAEFEHSCSGYSATHKTHLAKLLYKRCIIHAKNFRFYLFDVMTKKRQNRVSGDEEGVKDPGFGLIHLLYRVDWSQYTKPLHSEVSNSSNHKFLVTLAQVIIKG